MERTLQVYRQTSDCREPRYSSKCGIAWRYRRRCRPVGRPIATRRPRQRPGMCSIPSEAYREKNRAAARRSSSSRRGEWTCQPRGQPRAPTGQPKLGSLDVAPQCGEMKGGEDNRQPKGMREGRERGNEAGGKGHRVREGEGKGIGGTRVQREGRERGGVSPCGKIHTKGTKGWVEWMVERAPGVAPG